MVALRPKRIRLLDDATQPPANAATGVMRELAFRGEGWLALAGLTAAHQPTAVKPSGLTSALSATPISRRP